MTVKDGGLAGSPFPMLPPRFDTVEVTKLRRHADLDDVGSEDQADLGSK